MRQFANVSISQWENPYGNSPTNNGQHLYVTASAPAPPPPPPEPEPLPIVYRRIPAAFSYNPLAGQTAGETSSSNDNTQAGMLDVLSYVSSRAN